MVEDKIVDGEVLDEDQLNEVAGGTQDQVYGDYNQLKKLGFLIKDNSKSIPELVTTSMANLIKDLQDKGFDKEVAYTANWNSKKNVYGIGGDDSLTQKQFWAAINNFYSK